MAGWLAGGTDLSMVASAFDLDPLAHRAANASTVVAGCDPALADRTGEVLAAMREVGVWVRARLAGAERAGR